MIFKLNSDGVRQLLKSDEMQGLLADKAAAIQQRCGNGYEHDVTVGQNRANAMIWANTYQAKSDNRKNNTILKALGG